MKIYIFNILLLLLLEIGNYFIKFPKNKKEKIVVVLFFIVFFIEISFVGDFPSDISSYYLKFNTVDAEFKEIGFYGIIKLIFKDSYIGYLYINWLLKKIANNFIIVMIFVGFLVSYGYLKVIKSYSKDKWLSIIVLLTTQNIYYSWNIIRQILAVALFCFTFKFLIEEKWKKYFIMIFFITTIHFSAYILFPCYFMLKNKLILKLKIKRILILLTGILIYFHINKVIKLVTLFTYQEYNGIDSYRISEMPYSGILRMLVYSIFPFFFLDNLELKTKEENVIVNGYIIYLIVLVMSFKIWILERILYYFTPFLVLIYPLVLEKLKSRKKIKVILTIILVLLQIRLFILGKYYFFWENKNFYWGF